MNPQLNKHLQNSVEWSSTVSAAGSLPSLWSESNQLLSWGLATGSQWGSDLGTPWPQVQTFKVLMFVTHVITWVLWGVAHLVSKIIIKLFLDTLIGIPQDSLFSEWRFRKTSPAVLSVQPLWFSYSEDTSFLPIFVWNLHVCADGSSPTC